MEKRLMKKNFQLLSLLLLCFSLNAFAVFDLMINPSLEKGAVVYKDRCVLCHNQNGDGEGLLPVSMLFLQKPDLLNSKNSDDVHSLRYIIIWGGMENKMNIFSPPWGNELTWGEIESLIIFVKYLRKHNDKAVKLLNNIFVTKVKDIKAGQLIYKNRCAICHGEAGDGEGRIAKVIKAPMPSDLTQSVLSDTELKQIIANGGSALSRSSGMPSWKTELSSAELESVIEYIKTFRK